MVLLFIAHPWMDHITVIIAWWLPSTPCMMNASRLTLIDWAHCHPAAFNKIYWKGLVVCCRIFSSCCSQLSMVGASALCGGSTEAHKSSCRLVREAPRNLIYVPNIQYDWFFSYAGEELPSNVHNLLQKILGLSFFTVTYLLDLCEVTIV